MRARKRFCACKCTHVQLARLLQTLTLTEASEHRDDSENSSKDSGHGGHQATRMTERGEEVAEEYESSMGMSDAEAEEAEFLETVRREFKVLMPENGTILSVDEENRNSPGIEVWFEVLARVLCSRLQVSCLILSSSYMFMLHQY